LVIQENAMNTYPLKTCFAAFLLLSVVLASPARSLGSEGESLRVVTTLPDLKDLVERIGGDRVTVTALCRGRENIHAVSAKPSHLVALNRADMFVQIGLSLESSFIPNLLLTARNERIRAGSPGFINCSDGWESIEVPADLSRRGGDLHPQGNPHMNLCPGGGKHMAQRILEGLEAVDPDGREVYRSNHSAWLKELAPFEERWTAMSASWKGRKVVMYHQEFNYLAHDYGIDIVGTVEVKPGIPPTPNHVASLIETMQRDSVSAILTAGWSNNSTVREIAERTGARVIELPNMCGGHSGTESWIQMMDFTHQQLEKALAETESQR
jgi:ABC-type Zn uptake system ZnuABC Zn-binding protein ZnuA